MKEKRKTCKDCKFFNLLEEYKSEINGQCRFYPPVKCGFPMVKDYWWCGKYKPKKTESNV